MQWYTGLGNREIGQKSVRITRGLAIPHFKTASGNKDEVSVLQMGQSYTIHFIKLGRKSFKESSGEDEGSLFISREDFL